MVSEHDVTMAYRLFLGREPEDPNIVRNMAQAFRDISALRTEFLNSEEFRAIAGLPPSSDAGCKPLTWPPISVDASITSELLARMAARVENEFSEMGAAEPHWSVLTDERFRAANIHNTEEEFFQSGQIVMDDLAMTAGRCGTDLTKLESCFELGCGVGRITLFLARQFRHVVGADISSNHLRIARQVVSRAAIDNVSFLHLNKIASYNALPRYDFFFSVIVLQHNPPPFMAFILEKTLRNLNPGGIAYFQIPSYLPNYAFDLRAYLDSPPLVGNAEVHCVPQAILFELFSRAGCDILEVREDGSLGKHAISHRIMLRKAKVKAKAKAGD